MGVASSSIAWSSPTVASRGWSPAFPSRPGVRVLRGVWLDVFLILSLDPRRSEGRAYRDA